MICNTKINPVLLEYNLYISRNIDKFLLSWKQSQNRSPLILRGGRQVGKSASVAEFAKENFGNFAVADFESYPELGALFSANLDPFFILRGLEPLLNTRIIPGQTLLFFDEIQECPKAIASLRYFKEKMPDLHVIAAGSLLEFALGEVSFPVGRIEYAYLYPLAFDEFLRATKRDLLADSIPSWTQADSWGALSEVSSQLLLSALKEYMIVGGMPEAVSAYCRTNSFLEVQKIHDKLIRGFRDDIPKYTQGDLQKRNVALVFSRIAAHVGQQVTYTKILDDDSKRNKCSVFLLEKAMLLHLVKSTSPSGLPLGVHADDKTFKPVFIDIGLMQRILGRSAQQVLEIDDLVAAFKGQLAEQFVGQELMARGGGSENGELYYWRRASKSSTAEVDYIIVRDQQIIPVEVKSGSSGSLKSLHLLLNTYPNIKSGVCLQSITKITQLDKILFCPLFLAF